MWIYRTAAVLTALYLMIVPAFADYFFTVSGVPCNQTMVVPVNGNGVVSCWVSGICRDHFDQYSVTAYAAASCTQVSAYLNAQGSGNASYIDANSYAGSSLGEGSSDAMCMCDFGCISDGPFSIPC